uniref:Uncharacterized protein n=1 Tax=Candidatus Kentrum sp. LPFa TaxID=2126335 RepID=A0A450VY42_9GAMM|nr:MAG: hypothetical protein BECKLPF1236A_GA0070988_100263 [Candidatus Kentron sp. LPFa]
MRRGVVVFDIAKPLENEGTGKPHQKLCASYSSWLDKAEPNAHEEDFITPADEKRARVAIHPTAPNRSCCFIVRK